MIIILTNYLNLVTIYHVSGDSVQKFAIDARDASVAGLATDADLRQSQVLRLSQVLRRSQKRTLSRSSQTRDRRRRAIVAT